MRFGSMLAAAGAAAVLTGAATAQAATTVACGDVIKSSIKVANDPGPCAGSGLVVGHRNITIDLNGHRIAGDFTSAAGEGGIDNTGGFDGVTVKNGEIQAFTDGILLTGASGNQLRNLVVHDSTGDGIRLNGSSGNTIKKTFVSANDNEGIELGANSDANVLDQVTASRNQNTNVWINSGSDFNAVLDSDISRSAAYYGVDIRASHDNVIRGNRICSNAKNGVSIDGDAGAVDRNSVQDNYLCSNVGHGVRVAGPGSANRIIGNTAVAGDDQGIRVEAAAADTVLKSNKADLNATFGITVANGTTGTKLKDNRARDNGSVGIYVATTNFIDAGGNRASGSGFGAQNCIGITCSP